MGPAMILGARWLLPKKNLLNSIQLNLHSNISIDWCFVCPFRFITAIRMCAVGVVYIICRHKLIMVQSTVFIDDVAFGRQLFHRWWWIYRCPTVVTKLALIKPVLIEIATIINFIFTSMICRWISCANFPTSRRSSSFVTPITDVTATTATMAIRFDTRKSTTHRTIRCEGEIVFVVVIVIVVIVATSRWPRSMRRWKFVIKSTVIHVLFLHSASLYS